MSFELLPIDRIVPNAEQPRKFFDQVELNALADSILSNGLDQPILVRIIEGGRYEIVYGERRWRAHHLLVKRGHSSFSNIRAQVKSLSEDERDIKAIIENGQRADISPLEEARAYQRMIDRGMPIEVLAELIGKQIWRVQERIRLLNLAPALMKLYESGNLSQEAASEISRIADERGQLSVLKLVSGGKIKGYAEIRNAVDTVLGVKEQDSMFADMAPPSVAERKVVNRMELTVERMIRLVNAGWKDGECVIATRVDPGKATSMADRIESVRKCLHVMERQLRLAYAQRALLKEDGAATGIEPEREVVLHGVTTTRRTVSV